ncbi:MAG: hypothetical protein VYA69_03340 [Gemmatimonadota bacterium]|nr:hypothetical protein [Gemmatimonadota bacterium]
MRRRYRYLVFGAAIFWFGFPVSSSAQDKDFEKIRAGGGYTYLRFQETGAEAQPYGIHAHYAFNPRWELRSSIGYSRTNLGLFKASSIFVPESQSTIVPLQFGLTYTFRPSSAGSSLIDYRTYVTGGIGMLNTFYPGIQPSTPQNPARSGSTRFGLLAGPYAAVGIAATTLSEFPVSLDISFLRMYYYRSFTSALEPIDGLVYGAHVMISLSFMKRGRR